MGRSLQRLSKRKSYPDSSRFRRKMEKQLDQIYEGIVFFDGKSRILDIYNNFRLPIDGTKMG